MTAPDVLIPRRPVPPGPPVVLCLLSGPYLLLGGHRRELPEGSRRLAAFVALQGGRVDRRATAGALWAAGDDTRAAGNLRSALWRLRVAGADILDATPMVLRLRPDIVVDLDVQSAWATRLTEGRPRAEDVRDGAWRSVSLDLLPGWQEDWAVFERERLRQRILHGLEALSRLLLDTGRSLEAVDVAAATVRVDPLRESGQRVLIEAHLARGDLDRARQQYEVFGTLLARRLQVGPSAALAALVRVPEPATLLAPRQPAGASARP